MKALDEIEENVKSADDTDNEASPIAEDEPKSKDGKLDADDEKIDH